jgi:nickel-dependent lactate racemase
MAFHYYAGSARGKSILRVSSEKLYFHCHHHYSKLFEGNLSGEADSPARKDIEEAAGIAVFALS